MQQLLPRRCRALGNRNCARAPALCTRGARIRASASAVDDAPVDASASGSGGGVAVEFKGLHDKRMTVQGTMHLPASSDLIYNILRDYERAPEIFSNLTASSVQHQDDGVVVKQTCTWRFLVFSGTFDVELQVTELDATKELIFRLKRSRFMSDFEGRWQVQPCDGDTAVVTHTLSMAPVVSPPKAFASRAAQILVRQVHGIMTDLRGQVLNHSSLAAGP